MVIKEKLSNDAPIDVAIGVLGQFLAHDQTHEVGEECLMPVRKRSVFNIGRHLNWHLLFF